MNSPSIQPIQFDDFSEISTATNERKLYLGSLNNLQAAKFEKKICNTYYILINYIYLKM